MHLKRLVVVLLACGLVAAMSAPASAGSRTTHSGKTAQQRAIKLAVKGRSLRLLRFKIELNCRDGSELILTELGFLWTPIKRNGRFRDVQVGKTDEVSMRGRVARRSTRGSIRVTDKLNSGVRCKSGWVKFVARR